MRISVGRLGLGILTCLTAAVLAQAQTLTLTPAQERAIGIRTAALEPAAKTPLARLSGTFQPPPGGRQAVSAPFAGVVSQVSVIEGQAVRSGQTLAVVFSREALTASSELQSARAESTLASAAAARARQLVQEGVVAGARAEEADARAATARSVLAQRSLSVRAAGADASGRYVLRAPFAGRIARVEVEAGQGLAAMATAFVVDRQDRILVEAVLPAALAGRIQPGQGAAVEGVQGRIIAVGSAIDPRTRSLSVHAEVPPNPRFIPGRATHLEVFASGEGALSAPRSAVTPVGGRTVVFVRSGTGFVVTPVTVEGYAGDRAVLRGALRPGAQVAISGVSELKARAAP